MRETREKKISAKVIARSDLSKLWDFLNNQEMDPEQQLHYPTQKIQVRCADGTRYESENEECLREGGIIDLKKVESIDFEYRNIRARKRISIELEHDGRHGSNRLEVDGDDANWVAGTFSGLEMILESITPQKHWFPKYQILVFFILIFTFGFLAIQSIHLLFQGYFVRIVALTDGGIGEILTWVSAMFLLGIIPAEYATQKVSKLWPNIEFDFGPQHRRVERNRRIGIWFMFASIVLPVLLGFINDIILPKIIDSTSESELGQNE